MGHVHQQILRQLIAFVLFCIQFCTQLTKAYTAETDCNQLLFTYFVNKFVQLIIDNVLLRHHECLVLVT